MKLAVLFGGCSPEYSVSLQSAAAVLQNMDSSKYEAVMVGISKMGGWYSYKKRLDWRETCHAYNRDLLSVRKGGLMHSLCVRTPLILSASI